MCSGLPQFHSPNNFLISLPRLSGIVRSELSRIAVHKDNLLCFSQIDTIAGIRHSAIQGHSILMLQTDDIHESFYDLFNRRFQRIDDPNSGTRLYANIAIGAHLKPCRVHPKFQCIIAIKNSELDQAPAPFLNRFEKYYITHKDILEFVFKSLPPGIISVVEAAIKKVSTMTSVSCILHSQVYPM